MDGKEKRRAMRTFQEMKKLDYRLKCYADYLITLRSLYCGSGVYETAKRDTITSIHSDIEKLLKGNWHDDEND